MEGLIKTVWPILNLCVGMVRRRASEPPTAFYNRLGLTLNEIAQTDPFPGDED
jgi:hypothetical protein